MYANAIRLYICVITFVRKHHPQSFVINSVAEYSNKPFGECQVVYAILLSYTVNYSVL